MIAPSVPKSAIKSALQSNFKNVFFEIYIVYNVYIYILKYIYTVYFFKLVLIWGNFFIILIAYIQWPEAATRGVL